MTSDDILSIIFIFFMCVVISAVILKLYPNNPELIVPAYGLVAVCAWVFLDYVKVKKSQTRVARRAPTPDYSDSFSDSSDYSDSDDESDSPESSNEAITSILSGIKNGESDDITDENSDEYFDNSRGDIEKIFRRMGSNGDDRLAERSKYAGQQAKLSKDIRAVYNKYSFAPYVNEELNEQAAKIWWDNDQLDLMV